MAACICDMFPNTQAQRLYFPYAFNGWRWECRKFCNGGEITEVKLGFSWKSTPNGVAEIWPMSVTPHVWCIYGLCQWNQFGGAIMTHVCDTRCVTQICPMSVTTFGWRKYVLCLWQQWGLCKYGLGLWHQWDEANMTHVCETRSVAQIWPLSVTPVGWRKCDLGVWHKLTASSDLQHPIKAPHLRKLLSVSGSWWFPKGQPVGSDNCPDVFHCRRRFWACVVIWQKLQCYQWQLSVVIQRYNCLFCKLGPNWLNFHAGWNVWLWQSSGQRAESIVF